MPEYTMFEKYIIDKFVRINCDVVSGGFTWLGA